MQISIWTWSVQLYGVEHSIIHQCGYTTWNIHWYGMSIYMECENTPHFIISIWIQIWIWKCSVDLHGVRRHSTLCDIHMDTNMDIDMKCRSTWIQIRLWTWNVQLHGMWRHFIICKCGDTTWTTHPWIWIWGVDLHGV